MLKYVSPKITQVELDYNQAILTACMVGFAAFQGTFAGRCYAYVSSGTRAANPLCGVSPVSKSLGGGMGSYGENSTSPS